MRTNKYIITQSPDPEMRFTSLSPFPCNTTPEVRVKKKEREGDKKRDGERGEREREKIERRRARDSL